MGFSNLLNNELKDTVSDFGESYGYQGEFAEDETEETGYVAFELRNYDAVIGRWLSTDPYGQYASPYVGMGNNPVNRIDLDGGWDDFFIYSDGTIEQVETGPIDNFYYVDDGGNQTLLGTFTRNDNGLIQLPGNYGLSTPDFTFGFQTKAGQSDRMYIDPTGLASLMGALIETGTTDLMINQFSYSDGGSPYPSTSHINGRNGDLRYLRSDHSGGTVTVHQGQFDIYRNSQLTQALHRFGWTDMKSYRTTGPSGPNWILPRTSHLDHHADHLHLQGYSPSVSPVVAPSIRLR